MNDAIRWYREASDQIADDFWKEVHFNLSKIADHPERFHFDDSGFRRCNLKQFPFNILFREMSDRIRIVVIRHNKRDPKFGLNRKW